MLWNIKEEVCHGYFFPLWCGLLKTGKLLVKYRQLSHNFVKKVTL